MNRQRAELIARLILNRIGRVGDDLVRIRGETFRTVLVGNGINTDTYDATCDRHVEAWALEALVNKMDFSRFLDPRPVSNINPNPKPMTLPKGVRPRAAPPHFPYLHPTCAGTMPDYPIYPVGKPRQ